MPNRTIFIRSGNFAKALGKKEGVGPYINRLIEMDTSDDSVVEVSLSVEKKVIRKERAIEARKEAITILSDVEKKREIQDEGHICKKCGYRLFTYKGKCPNNCK